MTEAISYGNEAERMRTGVSAEMAVSFKTAGGGRWLPKISRHAGLAKHLCPIAFRLTPR
jgi:hypothetical protein